MARSLPNSAILTQLRFGLFNLNRAKRGNIILNKEIFNYGLDIISLNELHYQSFGVSHISPHVNIITGKGNPKTTIIIVNKSSKTSVIRYE